MYVREHRLKDKDAPEDEVEDATEDLKEATGHEPELTESEERYTVQERRAMSAALRRVVRNRYDEPCAVCDIRRETPAGTLEVEAPHIYPRSENCADDVRNGIALCKLHHWAFDNGWLAIDNDYEQMIRDAATHGGYDEFADLDGEELHLPDERRRQPHPKFLDAHRELHGFDHR